MTRPRLTTNQICLGLALLKAELWVRCSIDPFVYGYWLNANRERLNIEFRTADGYEEDEYGAWLQARFVAESLELVKS